MSSICTSIDSRYPANPTVTDNWTRNYEAGVSSLKAVCRTNSSLLDACLLAACLAVVTSVAVYDVYWSFKTQSILQETEQNPLGSLLIEMDGGDIALFMTCKMLGTMFVVLAVPALYCFRRWWGMSTGVSLASFQCLVFLYLIFGQLVYETPVP